MPDRPAAVQGQALIETLEQVQDQPVTPPSAIVLCVPGDVEAICLKCLRKEPAKRYMTAGQLAEDLRRFLQGMPVEAKPAGVFGRIAHRCRRNRLAAGLIGVLLLYSLIATALLCR